MNISRFPFFDHIARRLMGRGLRRHPDYVIGEDGSDPYLRRWWLIPRNRFFNIYLHHVRHSDDDRALHDHPWPNLTVVLAGGYVEVMPAHRDIWPWNRDLKRVTRTAGDLVFRRAADPHRLESGHTECWTLFITGPALRTWGFWCDLWRPWYEFTDPQNPGRAGRGCD